MTTNESLPYVIYSRSTGEIAERAADARAAFYAARRNNEVAKAAGRVADWTAKVEK